MDASTPNRTERRLHPRAACDWPIEIQLEDGTFEARLRDVSKAGVSFFLDRRIPEMTMLSMKIDLPPRHEMEKPVPIEGGGVVVRCQPLSPRLDHYEIAVFLNDITESNQERLSAYVAREVGSTP